MSDDLDLAGLLGEAPRTPDPGFRLDVLTLTAQCARRRASHRRALRTVLISTIVGVGFATAQLFGVGFAEVQPLLLVGGVLGLAYVLALLTIEGPRAVLARSRSMLRTSVMRV
jgi:hypothetical protein